MKWQSHLADFAIHTDDSRNVMASDSTGQTYRNFFEFGEMQPLRVPGKFDSYGLSQSVTVPWF
ncbi:type I-F CRISPR-associated endoribonuclease Cas6/Csy4 [Vibrio metschnikovii]|uniref:type I-F CRISPR-associated endoribonuclease Cas6/Csy4 n=1 Tax=Vibrio metschnikovii TaxID=28172 RepID=UPI002FCB3A25